MAKKTFGLHRRKIAKLFLRDVSGVSRHIEKHIDEGEVTKAICNFCKIAISDKPVAHYSLDIVLAVGYRLNHPEVRSSGVGNGFLHEYFAKRLCNEDDFLKNMGGGVY